MQFHVLASTVLVVEEQVSFTRDLDLDPSALVLVMGLLTEIDRLRLQLARH